MHRQPVRLLLPRCINVLKHLTSINASACWHNCRYLLGKCEFPMILYPFSTILLARKVACQREIPLISSFIATPPSLSLTVFRIFARTSFHRDRREISVKFLSVPFFPPFFFLFFLFFWYIISSIVEWRIPDSKFRTIEIVALIERVKSRQYRGTSLFVSDTSPDKWEGRKRHNSARYQAAW